MYKLFLLCLTILFFMPASLTQEIKKEWVDYITGEKIIETCYLNITNDINCRLKKVDTKCFFEISINFGDKLHTINKGAKFLIRFVNDSVITLYNERFIVAAYHRKKEKGKMVFSHYVLKPSYILNQTELECLKKYKIAEIEVNTNESSFQRKVEMLRSKMLQDLFNLTKN